MICRQCGEDRIPDFVTDRDLCRRCGPPLVLPPLPYRPTPYTQADLVNIERVREVMDAAAIARARARAAEAT